MKKKKKFFTTKCVNSYFFFHQIFKCCVLHWIIFCSVRHLIYIAYPFQLSLYLLASQKTKTNSVLSRFWSQNSFIIYCILHFFFSLSFFCSLLLKKTKLFNDPLYFLLSFLFFPLSSPLRKQTTK